MSEFMPEIIEWVRATRARTVMVQGACLRHMRVFFDSEGDPYVLMGRRCSRHKKYLSSMAGAKKIIGTETPVFYERAD